MSRVSLWDFSLGFYARPGVAQLSLALQDGHGMDVNLLMVAAWAGDVLGARLSEADVRELHKAGEFWREEVIAPIRDMRRGLKQTAAANGSAGLEPLYESAKALELGAEKLELEALERFASARLAGAVSTGDAGAAIDNIAAVLRHGGVPANDVEDALAVFRVALAPAA